MGAFGRVGIVMVMAACLGGAAFADEAPPDGDPLKVLVPNGAKEACFGRVYDKAHLKAHPNQKVERIYFFYGHDPISHPNEQSYDSTSDYTGFLTTTARGVKKADWAGGWCSKAPDSNEVHCGMECDRTLANLKLDDKGSLAVTDVNRDIYLDAGAEDELGEKEYKRQALGSEDDNFRLDRLPADACKAAFASIDPIDPALGPPLRQRLKPDQPFCYGRDYDAKHLGSHPQQVTASIRVFRGPTEIASYAETNKPQNWPDGADIVIAVATRQKPSKVIQSYGCQGEGDQWHCTATTRTSNSDCDISQKEIFLRRGKDGTMMLANPSNGLPIVDLCSTSGDQTRSDDKIYRLDAMAQTACSP